MPLAFVGFVWWGLLIKAIVLAVYWGGWCALFNNDHVEEHGRGGFAGLLGL